MKLIIEKGEEAEAQVSEGGGTAYLILGSNKVVAFYFDGTFQLLEGPPAKDWAREPARLKEIVFEKL